MVLKDFCVLVHWANVASALEGLTNIFLILLSPARCHQKFPSKFIFHRFSFPGATNDTLLAKFHRQHVDNEYYEKPQLKENAFIVVHYAGKIKYQVQVHKALVFCFKKCPTHSLIQQIVKSPLVAPLFFCEEFLKMSLKHMIKGQFHHE